MLSGVELPAKNKRLGTPFRREATLLAYPIGRPGPGR